MEEEAEEEGGEGKRRRHGGADICQGGRVTVTSPFSTASFFNKAAYQATALKTLSRSHARLRNRSKRTTPPKMESQPPFGFSVCRTKTGVGSDSQMACNPFSHRDSHFEVLNQGGGR